MDGTVSDAAESRGLSRLTTGTLAVVSTATFSLLAVLGFVGLFVRPSADDWCVLWKTRDMGVLGITKDYYMTQNGRISNAFISGVFAVDGSIRGMQIFPTLLVLSFGVGLVLLMRQVWKMLGWKAPLLAFVTAAVVIELALFAGAHDPYQAILWIPGTITHTLPTIIGVWAVYLGLRTAGSRLWVRALSVLVTLGVGVTLGTLAEPSLVMFGLLAGTTALFFNPLVKTVRSWYLFIWCAALCSGLVIGFLVLYSSPGAQLRRAQSKRQIGSMWSEATLNAAGGDWVRIMDIVTSQWTYLGALVVGLLIGILTVTSQRRGSGDTAAAADTVVLTAPPRRTPRWLIIAVLVLSAPLLLFGSYMVVLGLRQGYGPTGWRDARVWFNFVGPMVLALCAYGVVLGRTLRRSLTGRFQAVGAGTIAATTILAGAFLLASAGTLLSVVRTQADFTIVRAQAFDAQDRRIKAEVRRGATEPVYKPLQVPALAEPNANPKRPNFSDECAADYYQVKRLLPPPKPTPAPVKAAAKPATK